MAEIVYGVLIGLGLCGWMLWAREYGNRRWFQTRLHEVSAEYDDLVKAAVGYVVQRGSNRDG